MFPLNCCGSKDNTEGPSTYQPAEKDVVPPFSGKLSVDENLRLSHEEFKQTINDFFKDKNITPLSQLTATPAFPTPHVLAQFASKAYRDYRKGETDAQYETRLTLPEGWKLLTTASNSSKTNGYFGAAYWHPDHQQVVIAHRGTDPTTLGAILTDIVGVLFKCHAPQLGSASTFAYKVVEVLREVNRIKGVSFQLFFTGHSLGGWLAQITTFTTKYLKIEGNTFLKSANIPHSFHPHTVVFDSPGCKDMLSQMTDKFDVRLDGRSIDLEHLDITSYLSAPNRINTCKKHLGTVYRIFPDWSDMSWLKKHTTLYNLATHNMHKIVQTFDPKTGQAHKDEKGQLRVQVVVDWPISIGIRGGKEYKKFFEWAEHLNNYHPGITDESFRYSSIRYQTKIYDEQVKSLSVFSQEEQKFLQCYLGLRQCPKSFKPKELFSEMEDSQAQEEAEKILQRFEIENDTIICTDSIVLQILVPFVKRLLQLFPEIKEIGKKFYQCETRSCIKQINQSPIDFNPDSSSLREFLESEQQVMQVQMVDGDAWTGLIKFYQVLQKTNCLIEGQYTVLKLERFLTLNLFLDFSSLMLSSKTPYLILLAWEANQLLKAETKDMIRTIFETMKQKSFIKIILTTRSEDRTAHFLQHIGREIFGNGFVTRDEQLNWCDLTYSSQEKLLEKSVKFQDAKISLNELMSAECPVAKFLSLGALVEDKELKTADPVPISNGYNESYYIGRTLRHHRAIKQDIFNDRSIKEKHVFLSSAEQEFKQLCQLYPNGNVHWLEKDKSGKLFWLQSQGSLETLRKYIDTERSDTYTADDLDKLLEQAEHQRVMLISDTAGMGKSTLLTHLSKQIKQKFPAKWVVRTDLNNHTDELKALKEEQIDRKEAIEFVSEKLLKLKPGLELELFKQCCEKKQKVRIVIMLDGFDEISPLYKDTVIDLLQALRQTAVEQLWVTSRPHLRKELEDKLQQLSCTLESFSQKDQVEFLTKFWCLKEWFSEMNYKEKEESKKKIEMYATKLIKELVSSINDKDREFTGIPLQTRMLAEAFDKEVKTFCQSFGSMPELPFQLDLLVLYGRFIERKYDIYQKEKFQVVLNNVITIEQRERDLKNMRKDYQLLALKVLFTEEQVAMFQNNTECLFSATDLTRIGVVQINYEGKLHFIHHTFAEYYVADYLVNCLTEENKASEKVQTFILKDIFLEEDYRVIRVFIDGLLSMCKPSSQMLKQYGNLIHVLENDCLLHRAALEGNANIIEFLLDSVRVGGHVDTMSRLLLGKDIKGRTVWEMAAIEGNIQVLEKLGECTEEKQTRQKKKTKLLDTNKQGRTVRYVAAYCGKPDVLQKGRESAKVNLTTEEINNKLLATDSDGITAWRLVVKWDQLNILKLIRGAKEKLATESIKSYLLAKDSDGNTAWHQAVKLGQLHILQLIWECAKEKLTTEEISKLLLATDSDRNTAWHRAIKWGHLDILQLIWECAKEKLTTEEIKRKLLLATDSDGNTAWHQAVKWGHLDILQLIWECAKEKLTTEEIRSKLLLATDSYRNTAWHQAVRRGQLDILQLIWECAKEKLTTEEIKNKLLLATDSEGNTACHQAVKWGHLDILQLIWECAKEKLTIEELKNKLLATDNNRNTAFHLGATSDKLGLLQEMWELAKENLTTKEIKNKLLLAKDSEGNTAWHQAVKWGQLDNLQLIWECAKEKLTTEEIRSKLLLATDSYRNTAWHQAVRRGQLDILQLIWECAKEKLTTEEIRSKLLLATHSNGNTAWHNEVMMGQLDKLQLVWECAKEKLTIEELKNMLLLATNNMGNTAFHLEATSDKLGLLQEVWEWAKENLTTEEIKNKLLLATDSKGNTAWYHAVKWGKPDNLQFRWECAKEKLTTEEIRSKLLLVTDNNGNTVWHQAVRRGRLDILQLILECAKEKLTKEELKNKLLLATDNMGNTAFHLGAKSNKLDLLQNIWVLVKANVTADELKNKLLLATNNMGNTAYHLGAIFSELKQLQKIWGWAKENLTAEELKCKLLLATNNRKNNTFHFAAKRGKLDVLQEMWVWAKEILTTKEIKNDLLLATDSDGNTAWHWAVEFGELDVLQEIWEWAKDKLTTEEIKNNLLLAADSEGNTAWHKAAKWGEIDLLEQIWVWAEEILTTDERKNMVISH